jgi:hypothetical protein
MAQDVSENMIGFSLEDLALEDYAELLVRTPDDKIVRIKGQEDPWRLHIQRFRTPEIRTAYDKLQTQVKNGKLSDEGFTLSMCVILTSGWANGPVNFSKASLEEILKRPGFSWLRDLIWTSAIDDKNFMKGT